MDTPPRPRPFRIDTASVPATVEVDGVDVAEAIIGATVHVGYGQATKLVLTESRPGAVTATGIIEVASTIVDPVDAVRALDPQAVEETVMAGALDGDTMAANYLDVIATMLAADR